MFAFTAVFALSCEKEVNEAPVKEEVGMLEVSFVFNQTTAKSISLSPAFQTIEVEANLNIEGIKWNVISDQPWCVVESDITHEGSGSFAITVFANEGYDDREPAVVSLCTGEYKANLRVTQVGNVFIMDQVLGLGMKKAGRAEITVKVEEGTGWTTMQSDWLDVDVVEMATANGETEYKMTVQWDENTAASRLGAVELYRDGDEVPSSKYALWQFGDGVEYDFEADGSIRLASKPSAEIPLEIKTPTNHIETLKYPEWVQLEKVENNDNTTSWFLYFDPNASDSNSYRETQLTYTTISSDIEKSLPVIYQNYYHVGGLISGKGLALFAEKFNQGGEEAVGDWMKDGVVNVLSPIDMSALETPWESIGTEEHPFNLKFNGDNRNISGFTAAKPLFGVCDGAEIYNVALDKTCAVVVEEDCNDDVYLASLAEKITNTTIRNCTSAAGVTLSTNAVSNSLTVYAGGLVAYADANSLIVDSKYEGALDASLTRTASSGYVYIGGIAGSVACDIENCENAGLVTDNTLSKYHYVGGITGVCTADSKLMKCVNSGAVKHSSIRNANSVTDMNESLYIGGLVGRNYGDLNDLQNTGSVSVNSNAKNMYVGGVIGRVEEGALKKCYSTSGSVTYDKPMGADNTSANLGRYVSVGGVIGSLNIPLELNCSDMPVECDVDFAGMEKNGNLQVGGIIGVSTQKLKLISPKWSGNMNFHMTAETTEANKVNFGGIIGSADSAETTITGAETGGTIKIWAVRTIYWKVPTAVGGVLGCAANGCTISESINNASLLWDATSKSSSAGGVVSSGGIVGRIDKGLATISKCTNNGDVHNIVTHDAKWKPGYLLGARTGGIIGTYGYVKLSNNYDMDVNAFVPAESNNITITDCHTTSEILGYRGLVGGIAGCLYNATVKNCTYTGISSNKRNNCNVAGVAGAVENTRIEDCVVKASLYGSSAGSCEFKAGGIAAYLYTNSHISNCKYYGHITSGNNGTAVAYYGGIVAEAQAGCSVTGCSYGGSLLNKTITADNYAEHIVGNNAIEATNCSYWDGQ